MDYSAQSVTALLRGPLITTPQGWVVIFAAIVYFTLAVTFGAFDLAPAAGKKPQRRNHHLYFLAVHCVSAICKKWLAFIQAINLIRCNYWSLCRCSFHIRWLETLGVTQCIFTITQRCFVDNAPNNALKSFAPLTGTG